MTAQASNRTFTPDNTINKDVSVVGRKKRMEKDGEVVKDFTIGKTRIKINDAYCKDKTATDVQAILSHMATILQPALVARMTAK